MGSYWKFFIIREETRSSLLFPYLCMKDYRKYRKDLKRKIRKEIKLAKSRVPVDELNLRLLPSVLQKKIILREGLIQDFYREGDYVVDITGFTMYGDIYLLSADLNNTGLGEKIPYKQIWEGEAELYRRYDDWNGGEITFILPIIGEMSEYYGKFRLATKKEIELCQQ